MWNLKVAPYPAGKELKNTIIDMKKEIKMSFLKDVFNQFKQFPRLLSHA